MTAAMAAAAAGASIDGVRRVVAESPVVVVGRRGCCLGHVVKRLLQGLGVNPTVCELADGAAAAGASCGGTAVDDAAILEEFTGIGGGGGGGGGMLPAVFIGGKLVGGLERLMAVHISGELVPILKEAGALWL
ncbi:Monothiol glutaredoxin-S5 [Ananas comosus]|uniref:Monothiol glutaredoxin-S5 n=1 Tax=Ananas comosus TaxID=4615 RepID=A0A199VVY3_ANACO|nr:Monothiol glutaredoxin-S5 [Ananas comosus]